MFDLRRATVFLFRTPLLKAQNQARNQLGTPGGAKSFLRGAQTF